ncbi:MAG TPA: adenylate/guanylate cyclase domain-containing protein [Alphaproteobacteria bacterium]|nr:adenylate/guanylate cyclase domain-containing protein [Alphaproteobacteria bacterium]
MAATLNRLVLTFAPPEAERRYREARADADLRIMRVTYALGIALSSAYFIFDYLALGRFDPMLLAVRLIVVNAVIAVGLAATWVPGLKRRSAHIGGWVFLFHLVFFAAVNGYYPTPYVYTANGIITLGFLYLVWPLSLGMSCAYGIVGTAVYCAIVIAARPWSAEIELLLLIFASMNCICIFALYQTEYYRRSTYLTMQALDVERSRYHELLTSILPKEVADRLQRGETVADHYDDVSVLFVDLCDFTAISARFPPAQVVEWLNRVFSEFDALVAQYGLEKIKTVGDAYMVAGGFAPEPADHADAIVKLARHMLMVAERLPWPDGTPTRVRIGIHCGPEIAGVIGASRFLYDLWGDTVNTASRMESHGLPGRIQVSEAMRDRLADRYRFEAREAVDIKGKGRMTTWLLADARRQSATAAAPLPA